MTPETTITGDLLPDLLTNWCGPIEWHDGDGFVPGAITEKGIMFAEFTHPNGGHLYEEVVEDGGNEVETRLPLTRPECRSQLCRVLHARGNPAWHLLPVCEGGSLPDAFAQHSSALLAWHARDVAAGGRGVVGVLGEWCVDRNPDRVLHIRYPLIDEHGCAFARDVVRADGVAWTIKRRQYQDAIACGPETGEAGKSAADAAARAAGYALLDGDLLATCQGNLGLDDGCTAEDVAAVGECVPADILALLDALNEAEAEVARVAGERDEARRALLAERGEGEPREGWTFDRESWSRNVDGHLLQAAPPRYRGDSWGWSLWVPDLALDDSVILGQSGRAPNALEAIDAADKALRGEG